jgi:hypothetical protein
LYAIRTANETVVPPSLFSANQSEQAALLKRLKKEGYKCRALTEVVDSRTAVRVEKRLRKSGRSDLQAISEHR